MTIDSIPDKERAQLERFFDYLQVECFPTGPGERVRAYYLAERAGKSYRDRRLKTLLCPVFARSAEEQQRFYSAYDFFFRADQLPSAPPVPTGQRVVAPPQSVPPFNRRKWRRLGLAAVALSIALAGIDYFDLIGKLHHAVTAGSEQKNATPPAPTPAERPETTTATRQIQQKLQRGCRGMECVTQGNRPWVIAAPMLLYLLLLAAAQTAYWRSYRAVNRERSRVPPFTWPVVTLPPRAFSLEARLRFLAQALRRRISGDLRILDVAATLKATVKSGGFPSIAYQQSARMPEYLFLVEQRSPQDHLAAWTLAVCSALARAQVALDAYTYRGDPRRVFPYDLRLNARSPRSSRAAVNLRRLLVRSRGNRIALFTSGADLLHPYTGSLAAWAGNLFEDHECTVFVPGAMFEWGETERTLAQFFPMAPFRFRALGLALASDGSRDSLAGFLQQEESKESGSVPADCLQPAAASASGVPSLALFLDDDVFQWLCACAVHPVLDWNLTLHLAELVDPSGGLFRQPKILQLVRLPWFREGSIPGEWRARLVECASPPLLRNVREFLIAEMRNNPAPAGSFAADERAIQIAAQQYWNNPGANTRAVLERALANVPDVDVAHDALLEQLRREWKSAQRLEQVTETVRMAPHKLALDWRWVTVVVFLAVLGYMTTRQLWSVPYTKTVEEKVLVPVSAPANLGGQARLVESVGNQFFGLEELLRRVSATVDPRKNPQAAAAAIAAIYRDAGFKDVQVTWAIDPAGVLTFHITEGARWFFGDVNWDDIRQKIPGNPAAITQLNKLLGSRKGQPFTDAIVQTDEQTLKRLASPLLPFSPRFSYLTILNPGNHTVGIQFTSGELVPPRVLPAPADVALRNLGNGVSLCSFSGAAKPGEAPYRKTETCTIPNPDLLDVTYRTGSSVPGLEVQAGGTGNWSVPNSKMSGDQFSADTACSPGTSGCTVKVSVLGHYKGNFRPVIPTPAPPVDDLFEQEKNDETKLVHSAESLFQARDYARTIKFLVQAKALPDSGYWKISYPYLAGAYALTGDSRDFQSTVNEMLQGVRETVFLQVQLSREFIMKALKIAETAMVIGRRPKSELDVIANARATVQDFLDRMPVITDVTPKSIPEGTRSTVTLTGHFPDDVRLHATPPRAVISSKTDTRLVVAIDGGSVPNGEIFLNLNSEFGLVTTIVRVTQTQTLRVHVRYADGSPVVGWPVSIGKESVANGLVSTERVGGTVQTPPTGDVEFTSVMPGNYVITVESKPADSKSVSVFYGQATIADKTTDATVIVTTSTPKTSQQNPPQQTSQGKLPNTANAPPAARVNTGTITGTVVDDQGGVVPNVEVMLLSPPRQSADRTARTDAEGRYSFLNVVAGIYTMRALAPGFSALQRTGIIVTAQDSVVVDWRLTPPVKK